MPDWYLNAPQLLPGLDLFLQCFYDLDSCRQMGMSVGPIPWTAVQEWCDRREVCRDIRESVWYHVRKLDGIYLRHIEGRQPKKAKKNAPDPGKPAKESRKSVSPVGKQDVGGVGSRGRRRGG